MKLAVDVIENLKKQDHFISFCGNANSGKSIISLNFANYLLQLNNSVLFINYYKLQDSELIKTDSPLVHNGICIILINLKNSIMQFQVI